MTSDEDSRKEIVSLGGVQMMVSLLSSKNPQVLKNALGALTNLANEQESWQPMIEGGAVEVLLQIIDKEKDPLREYAAGVLVNLSYDQEARDIFKKNKGTKILSKILGQGNDELTRSGVGAFGNLAVEKDICQELRDYDSYKPIIESLLNKDEDIVARTSTAVWNLAVDGEESCQELIKLGTVENCCKALKVAQDPEIIGNCAMILSMLGSTEETSKFIRESGTLKIIVGGLGHDVSKVQQNCMAAVWNLSHFEDNRDPMRELGVVNGIYELLDSKEEEVLYTTLGALITLGPNQDIAQEFKDMDGVAKIVPFLEDQTHERICTYAILALGVLSIHDFHKDEVREKGAIELLIELLGAKSETIIEKVCSVMINLALNETNRTVIRQLDGIAPLIELLYHENPQIQQNAAGALWNLSSDPKNKKVIRELGGLAALFTLIEGGSIQPMKKSVPRAKDRPKDDDDDDFKSRSRAPIDDEDDELSGKISEVLKDPRKDLEDYIGKVRDRLKNDKAFITSLSEREKKILEDTTQDGLDWLHDNPRATDQEIKDKKSSMETRIEPIVSRVDAAIQLEEYAKNLKKRIKDDDDVFNMLTDEEKRKIKEVSDELLDWLQENPNATKEEIEKKKREMDGRIAEFIDRAESLNDFDNYAKNMRKNLDNENLTPKERKILDESTQEMIDWIKDHPNATKEEIEKKKKALKEKLEPMIQRVGVFEDLKNLGKDSQRRKDENEYLTTKEKKIIDEALDELDEWIKDNPGASKDEIERKKKEIMDRIEPMLSRAERMSELDTYGKDLKKRSDDQKYLTTKEKKILDDALEELNDWIKSNPGASKEDIEKKKKEIMDRIEPMLSRAYAMKDLDDYGQGLRKRRDEVGDLLSTKEKKVLDDVIQDISEWVQDHPDAKKDEIDKKKKEVYEKAEPIISRAETLKDLEGTANQVKKKKEKFENNLNAKEKKTIDNKVKDVSEWIKDHPDAKKDEIEKQKKSLINETEPIFSKAESLQSLDGGVNEVKKRKEKLSNFLTPKEKKQIDNQCEDIKDWIEDHPDAKKEDIEKKEKELNDKTNQIFSRAEALSGLNDYGKDIPNKISEREDVLTEKEKKTLENLVQDIDEWVKDNPDAPKEEIIKKKKQMKDRVEPILERADSMQSLKRTKEEIEQKKDQLGDCLTESENKKIQNAIEDLNDWVKDNKDAKKEEIEKKKKQLRDKVDPILQKGQAVSDLKELAKESKKKKDNLSDFLSEKEKKKVDRVIEDALEYLQDTPNAKKEDIEKEKLKMKESLNQIFKRAEDAKDLKDFTETVQKRKEDLGENLSKKEKKQVDDLVQDSLDWMKSNPDAKSEEISKKKKTLKEKVDVIFAHGDSVAKTKDTSRDLKQRTEELNEHLTEKEKKQISGILGDLEDWLKDHPDAKAEEVEKQRKDAQDKINKILSRAEQMQDLKSDSQKVKAQKENLKNTLTEKEKKLIDEQVKDLEEWLKKNPDAKKEDIEKKKKTFREKVDPVLERAQTMKDLRSFTNEVESKIDRYGDSLSSKEKKKLINELEDVRDWMKDHPDAKKEDINKERKQFNDKIVPILVKAESVIEAKKLANDVRKQRDELGNNLTEKEKQKIEDYCLDLEDWMKDNPDCKPEDIEKKKKELLSQSEPILKRGKAQQELTNYLTETQNRKDKVGEFLSEQEKQKIKDVLDDLQDWLVKNPNAKKEDIEKKHKESKDKIEAILTRGESMSELSETPEKTFQRMDDCDTYLTEKERRDVQNEVEDLQKWINANPNAKKDEIEKRKKNHNDKVNPILERVEALKNLEKLSNDIQNAKNYYGENLTEKEKKRIDDAIHEVDEWIKKNPNAKKEETEKKQKELRDKVDPIFARGQSILALEKSINDYQTKKNDFGESLSEKEKNTIDRETKNASEWIKAHPEASQIDIEKRTKELKDKLDTIVDRGQKMDELKKKLEESVSIKNDFSDVLTEKEKKKLQEAQNELSDWIKRNPDATKEEIEKKTKEFEDTLTPIYERAKAYDDLKKTNEEAKKKKSNFSQYISQKENKILDRQIDDLNDWLKDHKDSKQSEIEKRKKEFNDKVEPIFAKAKSLSELSESTEEVKNKKDKLGDNLNEKEKKQIDELVKGVDKWIKENPDAKNEDIEKKKKELKEKSEPLLKRGQAAQDFKNKVSEINDRTDKVSEFLSEKEKKQLKELSNEFSDWIKNNPNASKEEIEKKHKEFKDKAEKILARGEAMGHLNDSVKENKERGENVSDKITKSEKKTMDQRFVEVEDWIKGNPDAPKDEISKKKREMNEKVLPILERAETMKNLEKYNDEIKRAQEVFSDLLNDKEKREINKATSNTEDWIKENPSAKKLDIENQKKELKNKVEPILAKAQAIKGLENKVGEVEDIKDEHSDLISKKEEEILEKACKEAQEWLKANPDAKTRDVEKKSKEFSSKVDPIVERAQTQIETKEYCKTTKKLIEDDLGDILTKKEKQLIEDAIEELEDWIKSHPDASKDEVQKKKKEIQERIQPIVEKAEAKKNLDDLIKDTNIKFQNPLIAEKLTEKERETLKKEIESAKDWVKNNPNASTEELKKRRKQLEENTKPIVERAEAKKNLEEYAKDLKKKVDDEKELGSTLSEKDKRKIKKETEEALEWIKDNNNAPTKDIQNKLKDLEKSVQPIVEKGQALKELTTKSEEIKQRLNNESDPLSKATQKEKRTLDRECDDVQDWISENPNASKDEVIDRLKKFEDKTNPIVKKREALSSITEFSNNIRQRVNNNNDLGSRISEKDKKVIQESIKSSNEWLEETPDATPDQINKKKKDLEEVVKPIVERAEAEKALDEYTKSLKKRLGDESDPIQKLPSSELKKVKDAVQNASEWYQKNPYAEKSKIDEQIKLLDEKVKPVVEKVDAQDQLEDSLKDVKEKMKNIELLTKMNKDDVKLIEKEVKDLTDWKDKNSNTATSEEIIKKKTEFERKVNPIIEKAEAQEILENFATNLRNRLNDDNDIGGVVNEKERKILKDAVREGLDFLDKNPTKKEAMNKKQELEVKVNPVIETAESRQELDGYARDLLKKIREDEKLQKSLTTEEKKKFEKKTKETLDWLNDNPNATKEDIEEKKKELEDVVQKSIDKLDAKYDLVSEVDDVKNRLNGDLSKVLNNDEKKSIEKLTKDIEKWMDQNPNADKKKIEQKKSEFENQVAPIIKKAEARSDLQNYGNDVLKRLETDKKLQSNMSSQDKKQIENDTKQALDWIKKNEEKATAEQIQQKKLDLQDKIQPILNRAEATKDLAVAVQNVEEELKENGSLNQEEKKKIQDEVKKLKDWLDKNPKATKKDADERQQKLEEFINPILKRAEARKEIQDNVQDLKVRIEKDNLTKGMTETEKKTVNGKIAEVEEFFVKNKEPKVNEIKKKNEELKETVAPILENSKERQNLDNYAQDLKKRLNEDKNLSKDLSRDQLKQLDDTINESIDLLKKSPTASEALVQRKKLENVANPLFETAKKNMAERTKLENLAKNIQNQLDTVKQLKDLDATKRKNIENIAKDTENWLKQNPNASEQDIKDYMKKVYTLLGDQTNFKFSIWVVSNYGLGYGFQEATKWGKQPDLKKNDKPYMYTSYLGNTKKKETKKDENVNIPSFGSSSELSYQVSEKKETKPQIKIDASATQSQDWGNEIKKGAVSDVRAKFQQQKKLTKEEEELEKKFAELKKKKTNVGPDMKQFQVHK